MMFGTTNTETFAKRPSATEWCIVGGHDYQVNFPEVGLD